MDIQRIRSLAGILPIDIHTSYISIEQSPVQRLSSTDLVQTITDIAMDFIQCIKTDMVEYYYNIMCNQIQLQNGKWLYDSNELKLYIPQNWIGFSEILNNEYFVDIDNPDDYIKYTLYGHFIFVLSHEQLYVIYLSRKYSQKQHFVVTNNNTNIVKQLISDFPIIRILIKDYVAVADDSNVYAAELLSHLKTTVTDLDVLLSDYGVDGLLTIEDKITLYPNEEINQLLRNWHLFSGFADQYKFKVGQVSIIISNPSTKRLEPIKYHQDENVLWFTDGNIVRTNGTPKQILLVWEYIIEKMCIIFGLDYDNTILKEFILQHVYYYKKTGKSLVQK